MSIHKTLYILLKEANLIKEEKYITKPHRNKEKAQGCMWYGEIEVNTKNNLHFIFSFWYHCEDDNGNTWYPPQRMLNAMWKPKFVPKEKDYKGQLVDADWHVIYVNNHVYVSKKGFFHTMGKFNFDTCSDYNERKEEIIKSIKDGSWINDSDTWMII